MIMDYLSLLRDRDARVVPGVVIQHGHPPLFDVSGHSRPYLSVDGADNVAGASRKLRSVSARVPITSRVHADRQQLAAGPPGAARAPTGVPHQVAHLHPPVADSAPEIVAGTDVMLCQRNDPSLSLSILSSDPQKSQLEALNLLENRCPDMIGTDILCLRVLQSLRHRFRGEHSCWQAALTEQMSVIVSCLNPNSELFSLYQICRYFLSYNMVMHILVSPYCNHYLSLLQPLELIEYLKFLTKSEPFGWWNGDDSFVSVVMGLCYLLLKYAFRCSPCYRP